MIGVFDSGVGGLTALTELTALLPREDFIYLADTKNCPYGTKSREELLPIVKRNLALLRECGAEMILSACCTASTLYRALDADERRITVPIIEPAAEAAISAVGYSTPRITVIATEYTVSTSAFTAAIAERSEQAYVTELSAQRLVTLVERGMRDGNVDAEGEEYLLHLGEKILRTEPDVLILGCTHFSHLEQTLGEMLSGVRIVSPSREGARCLARIYNSGRETASQRGKLTFLRT